MDTTVSFKLRDVFPPDDESAALARFLVLARQTRGLRSALSALGGLPERTSEASIAVFACYVASIKELADAFHDVDTQGHFAWIEHSESPLTELASEIRDVRAAVNRDDQKSLYSRFLKQVRNSIGFHVKRGVVKEALEALQEERFHAADVTGPEQKVMAIPLVKSIFAHLIWDPAGGDAQLGSTFDQASRLHTLLENVSHDLYLLNVRLATESPSSAA